MSRREGGRAVVTQERVDRQLRDTRFNRLRGRHARRVLVGAMTATIALMPVAWLAGGSVWGIASVVLAAILWWALQVSVRTVADLPEEYLDERQERVRNQAYVEAYRILAAIAVLGSSAGLLAFIVLGQDPDTWTVTLSWNAVSAIFWVLTASSVALPSMVLAMRERPETPDDQEEPLP
jgi:hypothetical protein